MKKKLIIWAVTAALIAGTIFPAAADAAERRSGEEWSVARYYVGEYYDCKPLEVSSRGLAKDLSHIRPTIADAGTVLCIYENGRHTATVEGNRIYTVNY